MKKSAKSNLKYFKAVMDFFKDENTAILDYKLKRKDAIIDLANLSDNFQRMISDPKNQQKKLENVHQFVTTSHLITAYIASFSQYSKSAEEYPEIDTKSWDRKISAEILRTNLILNKKNPHKDILDESRLKPEDSIENLLEKSGRI